MKNTQYLVSYIFTLIIGVLLLVYSRQTNIFEIIVVVIGICFIIPSLVGLYMGFAGKKQTDGSRKSRPWYIGTSAIAGLVGGVLLVAMPGFFVHYLIYTFGVILVVAGIIQILFLSAEGRDIGGMPTAWFIMPWIIVATGIAIIIIGPEKLADAATIVTGIALTLYSINGLLSASAHKLTTRRMARSVAKATGVEKAEVREETGAEADSTDATAEVTKEKEDSPEGEP